jgi:hypothetical protein
MRIRHIPTLLLSIGLTGVCSAQTTLVTTDDTWLDGNRPDKSYGSGSEPLYVHNWGPKQLLVRFDATNLDPAVDTAILEVRLTDLWTTGQIDVYAVVEPWSESTASYNQSPATEPTPFTSVTVEPSQIGSDVTIDVTTAVERWIDGSLPAEGFLLTTNDSIRAVFASKEIGAAPALDVSTGNGGGNGSRPHILDFSSSLPVTIVEPGEYALDRNWSLGTAAGFLGTVLRIEADDVRIDFEGYFLQSNHQGQVVEVHGDRVSFRNGRLPGNPYQVVLTSTGRQLEVDQMTIYSSEVLELEGDRTVIRDSDVFVQWGLILGGEQAVVEQSGFYGCNIRCLQVNGVGGEIRGNEFTTDSNFNDDVVVIDGSYTVFDGNLIDQRAIDVTYSMLAINGPQNRAANNTFILGSNTTAAIAVNGMNNTIDSNIARPGPFGASADQGVTFTADGNFYGDNRMDATIPFNLSGTTQTDWGGNVGY